MPSLGFRHFAMGFGLVILYVVPSTKAATLAGSIDPGTVVNAVNVNAAILNLADPSDAQTYTYNQLIQSSNSSLMSITLDNGNTVAQELTALGYAQNDGVLNYNFPFALGASGSYSQDGTPAFGLNNIGPSLFQSLTATSVSGTVCSGFNSVGAGISVDPTNGAQTYDTILGCDSLEVSDPGIPTSTTSTVTIFLGTITEGNNIYDVSGEETIKTWTVSSIVGQSQVSAVPEPSGLWVGVAGMMALCLGRTGTRFRSKKEQFRHAPDECVVHLGGVRE